MQKHKKFPRKMRLGIFGSHTSPKLYQALQIGYGLAGSWDRIIVLDVTGHGDRYNILGPYSTFGIHELSSPSRYMELLNIAQGCNKDVIIFNTFSPEWKHGVSGYLNGFNYEDLLRAHRDLMNMIRYSSSHIICLVDTERKFSFSVKDGKPSLSLTQRPIQQERIDRYFTSVINTDRKGNVSTVKDLTDILPTARPFKVNAQVGAAFQDWCNEGRALIPADLQQKINNCTTISELYQLLFQEDIEDVEQIAAFTTRRLELESKEQEDTVDNLPW